MKERINQIRHTAAQYGITTSNAAAAWLVLMLVASGLATAQTLTEQTWSDDFENGNVDGWQGRAEISQTSTEGNYSLYSYDGVPNQTENPTWTNGPVLDLEKEFTTNGTVYVNQGDGSLRTGVGIVKQEEDGSGAVGAILVFSGEHGATFLAENAGNDPGGEYISGSFDNTWVNYRIRSNADDTTIEAKAWEAGTSEPSSWHISRNMTPESGKFSLFLGTSDIGREMYLDSVSVTGVEQTNPNLTLVHNRWMDHGETQPYTVTFKNESVKKNVTANSNVESMNRSVVTFNNDNYTMTATNDESVAARVLTRASYNGTVDYSYVTVADVEVENLEILPPIYRFGATIGDDTIFFLIIAMFTAVVGTRFTTAFGGICVYQLVVMMGWFSGWIQFGLMLLITMTAIFLGLNLAANIDYGTISR